VERTVGAALRGRPAWDSVLCRPVRRVAEIAFDAGRPRRAAPTVRTSVRNLLARLFFPFRGRSLL